MLRFGWMIRKVVGSIVRFLRGRDDASKVGLVFRARSERKSNDAARLLVQAYMRSKSPPLLKGTRPAPHHLS